MDFNTASELPFASPLDGEREVQIPGALVLRDLTPSLGVWHLRDPEAQAAVQRFGASGFERGAHSEIGQARSIGSGVLCRLAADEFLLLIASPDNWDSLRARLAGAADGLRASASDLTHAYGVLGLSGPLSAEALPRLCGLDFSETGFPDGRVAQTSLVKVQAAVVRVDTQPGRSPGFYLLVDRSLAAYVWEVIKQVIKEVKP